MKPVNLAIKHATTGDEIAIGKLVPYRGKTILHAWIKSSYRRLDIDALGFNIHALRFAQEQGAEEVYLYDPRANVTYSTWIGVVLDYGTSGAADGYGGNINLPLDEWQQQPGKLDVPYVPASATRIVRPKLQPAPEPVAEVQWEDSAPPEEEQLALWGESA